MLFGRYNPLTFPNFPKLSSTFRYFPPLYLTFPHFPTLFIHISSSLCFCTLLPTQTLFNMKLKPYDVCDTLGRQRTSLGQEKLLLLPTHDLFIRQTYFHTYRKPGNKDHKKVQDRLQCILKLSAYIWILVATSLTFSHIEQINDFDECIKRIWHWKDIHPISEHLEESARGILKGLDKQKERIMQGNAQE